MSKKNIIIVCAIVSVGVVSTFVYLFGRAYEKEKFRSKVTQNYINVRNQTGDDKNIITQTSSAKEEKVSPSAKMEMIQYYEECGHVVKDEYKVPSAVVNMNEEDVKNYYSGWDVKSFSKDNIILYKINKGICSEHYVLRDVDGYVNVFFKGTEGEVLYRATDILTRYLSDSDQASLKNGIKIIGKSDMEKMLEDFE